MYSKNMLEKLQTVLNNQLPIKHFDKINKKKEH